MYDSILVIMWFIFTIAILIFRKEIPNWEVYFAMGIICAQIWKAKN